MIKVESMVKVYEIDGAEQRTREVSIRVKSHWNRNEFIVIEWLDGAKVTVVAKDLRAAVSNAENSAR